MAVIVNILKEVVKLKFNDKMEKLEYEVDCVVEDIRKGKSPGLNIKQLLENIEKAKKEKEKVEKTRKDAERIYDALVIAKKIYDATDKSTTIASALNPAAAAIGYATRFLIDLAEKELLDLKNIIEVVPPLAKNFGSFLKRARGRIILALAAAALKQKATKERRNMVG